MGSVDRSQRYVAAAIAALLAVVTTYALLRAYAVLFQNDPDPALVAVSAHIPMFWRLGIGTYAAGFVALVVFFVSGRDPSATLRVVLAAIAPVACLVAIQGVFLP